MHGRGVGIAGFALLVVLSAVAVLPPQRLAAQAQPPSEKLLIRGTSAATWFTEEGDVVQVEGPVVIDLDRARLRARQAVVWLTPDPAVEDQQRAEIVLIGNASVDREDATREGDRLFVTGTIRGRIRITAERRENRALTNTELYRTAAAIRARSTGREDPNAARPPAEPPAPQPQQRVRPPVTQPVGVEPADQRPRPTTRRTRPGGPATTAPTTAPAAREPARDPVLFQAPQVETVETGDGKVAVVLSQGVTLIQRRAAGDMIELQANKAVLFTPLESLRELQEADQIKRIQDAVTGVYLEGDVRVVYTPAGGPVGEQRLRAKRVYYDFETDRAVLTNAVVHTIEPGRNLPVVIRARRIRQLALGEYTAEKVELSTSQFALPSFSIAADRIYVRTEDTGNPRLGSRITFNSRDTRLKAFGVPIFWLPVAGGSITERGFPLRGAGFENSKRFGTGIRTQWGLFESLGMVPPADLDASYRVDYFSDRGPAFGLEADYDGGFLTDPNKERWAFEGELESYFLPSDEGFDSFGRLPTRQDEQGEWRGQALWTHQHFFPDDWHAQVRAGYLSDATFLEEWFERDFENGLPRDVLLYLKRQRDTEAFTLTLQFQPNNLVTTADLLQEQFEVERLPQIGYHRIGDSLFDDRATFFSDNTLAALRMNRTGASLREQGFPESGNPGPGIPSLGTTGIDTGVNYRGDFRQEVNFPFSLGQFRVVPYVLGRYTGYSDTPDGGADNRFFGGAGARINTSFWAVDNSVESRLFDLHRMRHVIEPELHVFTAGTTVDRSEVFVYDEPIDATNDVSAAQVALRQRWQTKRGGPGRWRSVDVFTLNVEANFFANEPADEFLTPLGFRGLFFPTLPEASIPRDSLNADGLWRITDNTAVIADAQYNLNEDVLATASVGLVVRRDERLLYFVGTRYIEELDSNITTLFVEYDLSPKYSVAASQSYDFGLSENVSSSLEVRRRFDQFFMTFKLHYNERDNQSGFSFNIYPAGFGYGVDTDQLDSAFNDE